MLQIENAMDPNQAFNRMESVETFDYEGKEWPAPKPINAYVPEEEPSDIPVAHITEIRLTIPFRLITMTMKTVSGTIT